MCIRDRAISPGQSFELQIWRQGVFQDLTPTAGERETAVATQLKGMQLAMREDTNQEVFLVIEYVSPDSPAARANLSAGDILYEVNQQRVYNIPDATKQLSKSQSRYSLTIIRNGTPYQTVID